MWFLFNPDFSAAIFLLFSQYFHPLYRFSLLKKKATLVYKIEEFKKNQMFQTYENNYSE